MKITFSCESCMSEFTVDEQLAGRSGRCKKCGAKFVVPTAAVAVRDHQELRFAPDPPVATGGQRVPMATGAKTAAKGPVKQYAAERSESLMDRLTSSFKLKPAADEPLRVAKPKFAGKPDGVPSQQRAAGWLDAVNTHIALKPISVDSVVSAGRARDLQPDSISYRPSASDLKELRKKKKSKKAGFLHQSYDQLFRKTAKAFRWINETAYGISILFMILAIVGYIMQLTETGAKTKSARSARSAQVSTSSEGTKALPLPNHRLITIGVSGIVILNLVRLAAGLINLAAIPFRKSLVDGILFLIPPLTFFYIWQNWKRMEKPVGRIVGPLFALGLVLAAYTAIGMFGGGRSARGGLLNNVGRAVNTMKSDVNSTVEKVQDKVESIQNQLPSQIDNARRAVDDLRGRDQQNGNERPAPQTNSVPE